MRRFGQVIRVKPEKLDHYLALHARPWPSVLKMISDCNIRNYSIFLLQDNQLFAYFEYTGSDFSADMQRMAADAETRRWWAETDPCQESLGLVPGEWWHNMREVFHYD
ncbi:MAG: L-rhamnose mutarotase [Bacteroidales bacterium]|nr:L-rhamnose mutarotase [Bacteroidales bacterium]